MFQTPPHQNEFSPDMDAIFGTYLSFNTLVYHSVSPFCTILLFERWANDRIIVCLATWCWHYCTITHLFIGKKAICGRYMKRLIIKATKLYCSTFLSTLTDPNSTWFTSLFPLWTWSIGSSKCFKIWGQNFIPKTWELLFSDICLEGRGMPWFNWHNYTCFLWRTYSVAS